MNWNDFFPVSMLVSHTLDGEKQKIKSGWTISGHNYDFESQIFLWNLFLSLLLATTLIPRILEYFAANREKSIHSICRQLSISFELFYYYFIQMLKPSQYPPNGHWSIKRFEKSTRRLNASICQRNSHERWSNCEIFNDFFFSHE